MISEGSIVYLNPRDLKPSRRNVRSDPGDLAGLAETIREHGILQPLGVRRESDGYRIVYGNRRRDAAIVVGLDRVPCVVVDVADDDQVVVQQVLENLQRLDLNDMEKARAFGQLQAHLVEIGLGQGEAQENMARTLGLSVRQIQRYLRLLALTAWVQGLIAQGEFGVTHAQHLAELDPTRQEEVAQLVVEESLSAAELSRLVAALGHNTNIAPALALQMLRRGERVAPVEARPAEPVPHFGPTPSSEPADSGPWEEGDGEGQAETAASPTAETPPWERDEDGGRGDFAHMEPTTQDGNRVFKLHSLDSFMDELQRLARCVQDGDLQRLAEEDPGSGVKLRLAARQFQFLHEAVSALAQAVSP